jgi:nitrite reductase/ring-hydroxylating ferredoxin subunit
MTTAEQELLLTQTGPGTPLGGLLRRYWLPFAAAGELDEQPVQPIRILSESLVAFKDTSGRVGLIQERCPHGGYAMVEGHVEETGIACARHGWHFDVEGSCFIVNLTGKVYPMAWAHAKTYPVAEHAGLLWAYLGPQPAPPLPSYDVLDRRGGRLRITVYPVLDIDWFTAFSSVCQGADAAAEQLLPGHESAEVLWLQTPIDDTHTWQVAVEFIPSGDSAPEVIRAESGPEPIGHGADSPRATDALRERLLREIERAEQG